MLLGLFFPGQQVIFDVLSTDGIAARRDFFYINKAPNLL